MGDNRGSTVLVTGAGGFVGRILLPTLALAGNRVVAALRARPDTPSKSEGGRSVYFDLRDVDASMAAFEDIDVVVHLAGLAHAPAKESDAGILQEVNVVGTRNLARSAAASGTKRFIYLSTVKVHGEETTDRPFSVADEPDPKDTYAVSKLEAERELRKVESESGLEVVIIRPPLVYGPGVKGNLASLAKLIRRGLPVPTGAIENRRDLVSVYNLCDFIRVCISCPDAAGSTFLVCDGEALNINDIVQYLADGMGYRERVISSPLWLLKTTATFAGRADQFRKMTSNLEVDMSEAVRILGWTPPYTVAESFAKMFSEEAIP
jgi:nucleoside-diphosphate-sugar epimerase